MAVERQRIFALYRAVAAVPEARGEPETDTIMGWLRG